MLAHPSLAFAAHRAVECRIMTEPATTPAREPSAPAPQAGRTWDGAAAPILLVAALVLYPLFLGDRATLHDLQILLWAALALVAFMDRRPISPPRLRQAAAVFALLAAAPVVVGILAGAGRATWLDSLKYEVWLILAVDVWLVSGLAQERATAGVPRVAVVLSAVLLAVAGWCLASATASTVPKFPMKLWGAEIGTYLGVFVVAVRLLARPRGAEALARRGIWILTLCILAAMLAVVAVYAAGGAPGAWLRAAEFIRTEAEDPAAPWRLQFPFSHHNRAAFFTLCAAGILGAELAAGRFGRAANAAGIVMAAAAMAFTVTRGALLAAFAGGLVIIAGVLATTLPRRRWLLVLFVIPVLWFALPEAHQRQISQVFSANSYKPGPGTSIGARIELWGLTAGIVAGHPLLGIGYGHDTFEAYTLANHPQVTKRLEGMSHAHNQWLEAAAESGVPAALLLAAFTVMRIGWLGAAWNRARMRRDPLAAVLLVWLALEVAIQAYAMTNHVMRRNIGVFTHVIWAVSCVLAMRADRRGDGAAATASRPPA
jgi:O-antigen ligase